MKEKWFTKQIREAKQTKLTRAEKQHMLAAILGEARVPSPYYFVVSDFIKNYHRQAVAFAVVFALVITTGGTSYAAASALPGEALYSIKVNVNEEIQSLVALSPDAKARVGIARTTKRLKEAEQLAGEGRLTPEAQVIIKENIKNHGNDIKENLAVLASTNSTTTAQAVVSDFRASVEAIAPTPAPDANAGSASSSSAAAADVALLKTVAVDVEADAQAVGLLSIAEELKAEIVVIEEKLAGSSTAPVAPGVAATSTDAVIPELPLIEASTTAEAVLRVQ